MALLVAGPLRPGDERQAAAREEARVVVCCARAEDDRRRLLAARTGERVELWGYGFVRNICARIRYHVAPFLLVKALDAWEDEYDSP